MHAKTSSVICSIIAAMFLILTALVAVGVIDGVSYTEPLKVAIFSIAAAVILNIVGNYQETLERPDGQK